MTKTKHLAALDLPPPVHGMSNVNSYIESKLRGKVGVSILNLGKGARSLGIWLSTVKVYRYGLCSLWVLLGQTQLSSVYNCANGGRLLVMNLALAFACRLRGVKLILHHHSFNYINRIDWKMKCIDWLMKKNGTHVFLCQCMEHKFTKKYNSVTTTLVAMNPISDLEITDKLQDNTPQRPIVFGHLSNLTNEKGLDTVLSCILRLQQDGMNTKLLLAGPCGPDERKVIDSAITESKGSIVYLGPIYGSEKNNFFRKIDAFLFPTRYKNEAQPLVIIESITSGVPVITTDRGCISELVGSNAGIVTTETDYQNAVLEFVKQEMIDRNHYLERTKERAEEIKSIALEGANKLVSLILK